MSTSFVFKTLSNAKWSAVRSLIQWLPCLVCLYVLLVGAGSEKSSATIVGDEMRAKRIILEDADGRPVGAWSGEGIRTNRILIDDAEGKIVGSWRGDGLRANRIVLEDADGRLVGTWGPSPNLGGSIELVIHAPREKKGNTSIKLRASEGAAEVYVDGGGVGGDVIMQTEKWGSNILFLAPCPQVNLGTTKSPLAMLGARDDQGFLNVYKEIRLDEVDKHAHSRETLLKVP